MKDKNTIQDSPRTTVLTISTGFLALYFLFGWEWTIVVSFIIGITSILSLYVSRKIAWVWMQLAKYLGYVIPNILLGIVFFFFLYPLSLLSRIFNKDPLMLSNRYNSYFIDVNKETDKKDFEKTW